MRAINRCHLGAAIVILWVSQPISHATAAETIVDKKFPATPGGVLNIDTDEGSIKVTGVEGREVIVHVEVSGSSAQLRDFDVSADSDSRGVSVRGKRDNYSWFDLSRWFGGGLRARFEVQVPRDYQLELRTSGGSIESKDINGKVHGHTSGGHIVLNSINGDIDMHTSGGRIEARQLIGNTLLRTSGGSIHVADTRGPLEVKTSGGSIHLDNIDGKVTAKTSGGSIEARLRGANRGVELNTSGGSIRVHVPKDFKANLDAHTSGGGVHCDLPLTTRGREDNERRKNSLAGEINGGGEALYLHTAGGSITISANE